VIDEKTVRIARKVTIDLITARAEGRAELPSLATYMRNEDVEVSERNIAHVNAALLAVANELGRQWT
jgi:hypothetical protein